VPRVVSVVFNDGGKVYHFDPGELPLETGETVVVSTARGTELGRVVTGVQEVEEGQTQGRLKRVVRRASDDDLARAETQAVAEAEALAACRELVAELGIAMKPISAESTFDGNRLTIVFSAEERVDFRELVGSLSARLDRRVEMRQVSARDEARLVGGYGQCGRRLCCTLWSGNQEPVSIRMAKDQSLPLNPSKISGCCGRLMCCLKYEHGVYVGFKKRAPKRGSFVTTPAGKGKVTELLAASDSVSVDLGEGRVVKCRLCELDGLNDEPREEG
jgi:cell fate regulator YaaT (PSP1 superfamily)